MLCTATDAGRGVTGWITSCCSALNPWLGAFSQLFVNKRPQMSIVVHPYSPWPTKVHILDIGRTMRNSLDQHSAGSVNDSRPKRSIDGFMRGDLGVRSTRRESWDLAQSRRLGLRHWFTCKASGKYTNALGFEVVVAGTSNAMSAVFRPHGNGFTETSRGSIYHIKMRQLRHMRSRGRLQVQHIMYFTSPVKRPWHSFNL